jgi:putative transposase
LQAVKAISFRYKASEELSSLFEDFRLMCNDAIRIALEKKPKSRFELIELACSRLKEFGLQSHYVLSACEVAYSVYKNKNRKSIPYVRRAFLKLDNQTYRLNHLLLRIPSTPRRFIYLTLQGSDFHLSFIGNSALKKGSVTITDRTVSFALSKRVAPIELLGRVGIDVNERNVTTSNTLGVSKAFDTSEVAELRERYKAIRAKIGQRTRQDNRIGRRLYAKYGERERDRTSQVLHRISKTIIKDAKEGKLGVMMEKLKGIRRLYRKGNGQGTSYRGRMNTWSFHEIQRQIEYKAAWNGIPITYVNPRGTSSKCPNCGSSLLELEGRKLMCPSCNKSEDRDVIAAKNIMACAVPQVRPSR